MIDIHLGSFTCLHASLPPSQSVLNNMADADLFAAMGISGFGKAPKKSKPAVNVSSFARNKRVSARHIAALNGEYSPRFLESLA